MRGLRTVLAFAVFAIATSEVEALAPGSTVGSLSAVSTEMDVDSPFSVFARRSELGLRAGCAAAATGDDNTDSLRQPARGLPHLQRRMLAFSGPAFVDASQDKMTGQKSIAKVAEEVFDRVSVAGGVVVMGMRISMLLP